MNTGRGYAAGCGASNTAALVSGGATPPKTANVELWNGSTWTETTNLPTGRQNHAAGGNSTNALFFAGLAPSLTGTSVEWRGAGAPVGAWSTGGNYNNARRVAGAAGTSSSAAIMFGGTPSPLKAKTESYNGTAWTNVNDLNTGRRDIAGNGSQSAAIAFGGDAPPYVAATEIWNGSSWATGSLTSARAYMASAISGTSTATLGFGGYTTPPVSLSALTERWNGSSWAEVGDLNTAVANHGGLGTQTAALSFGGSIPATTNHSEYWNGTSWTETATLNTARNAAAGAGTTSSGLAITGTVPPQTAVVEEWNGATWTEVADVSKGRTNSIGTGSTTSAINAGGELAPGTLDDSSDEWVNTSSSTKTISTD